MKKLIVLLVILNWSCASIKKTNTIKELRFIGEQIIPSNSIYKNTKVGGLSSIDYANGKYYLISDDRKKSIRFYEMELDYNKNNFKKVTITNVIKIDIDQKGLDPESLRYDKKNNHFLWTSEGDIRKNIDPKVFEIDFNGKPIKTYKTPSIFLAKNNKKNYGTRRNGTFEGLSMSKNAKFYWLGMELPLKQDGKEPQIATGNYPIRISKINKKTNKLVYQFAYLLDNIPRNSIPKNKFIVNGCPEILELNKNNFLFIERAYASGHKDGGNTIKIYLVNNKNATDISNIKALKQADFKTATKKLIFNFEAIRSKLTDGIIDNIEGITFGKKLANGNQTIVVVSDNNFNKFSKQLNQIIVLEVIK